MPRFRGGLPRWSLRQPKNLMFSMAGFRTDTEAPLPAAERTDARDRTELRLYTALARVGCCGFRLPREGRARPLHQGGDGPNLVLIHTVRTQLDLFQFVVPLLAKHFTVYALDLPG